MELVIIGGQPALADVIYKVGDTVRLAHVSGTNAFYGKVGTIKDLYPNSKGQVVAEVIIGSATVHVDAGRIELVESLKAPQKHFDLFNPSSRVTAAIDTTYFDSDTFAKRRTNQSGGGVAHDPESLLTGDEIARGLTYRDKRVWPSQQAYDDAVSGKTPVSEIPRIAPRVNRTGHNWYKHVSEVKPQCCR